MYLIKNCPEYHEMPMHYYDRIFFTFPQDFYSVGLLVYELQECSKFEAEYVVHNGHIEIFKKGLNWLYEDNIASSLAEGKVGCFAKIKGVINK